VDDLEKRNVLKDKYGSETARILLAFSLNSLMLNIDIKDDISKE